MDKFLILFLCSIVSVGLLNKSKLDAKRSIASVKGSKIGSRAISSVKSIKELRSFASNNSLVEKELYGILSKEYVENFETKTYSEKVILVDGSYTQEVSPLNSIDESLIGKEVVFSAVSIDGKNYGFVSDSRAATYDDEKPFDGEKEIIFLVDYNDSNPPFQHPDRPILERSTLANHLNKNFYAKYIKDVFRGHRKNRVLKVSGWHRINRNCEDTSYPGHPGNTGYFSKDEIKDLFASTGIDHSKYTHVSVIVNCLLWHSWGDATLSKSLVFDDGHKMSFAKTYAGNRRLNYGITSDPTPYLNPNKNFMRAFLHERVHAFGFGHAYGLDCKLNKVQFPCNIQNYGNPYDTMGTGVDVTAINADVLRTKSIRGDQQYITIDRDGIYEISPLLTEDDSATIGVYIKSEFSDKPVFMLENRTALSVDRSLMLPEFNEVKNGLSIYTAISSSKLNVGERNPRYDHPQTKSPSFGISFRFLDAKPSSHTNLNESFIVRSKYDAISENNSFYDPITGIGINVLSGLSSSKSGGKIKFEVKFHNQKRVCFKSRLVNQIKNVTIRKINEKGDPIYSSSKIAYVKPGENFRFEVESIRDNPLYCPRDEVEIELMNPEVFEPFVDVRDEDTGIIIPVIDSLPKSNGIKQDGGGFDDGNDSTGFVLSRKVKDYNRINSLSAIVYKVPAISRSSKTFNLDFKYTNKRTQETHIKTLKLNYRPH